MEPRVPTPEHDIEKDDTKGGGHDVAVSSAAPPEHLKRQLRARHASMLAIGGAIGTGLIIGSGIGLARAGPVGLLIAFIYVGSLCFAMMVVSAVQHRMVSTTS
jgi:amino acid permease